MIPYALRLSYLLIALLASLWQAPAQEAERRADYWQAPRERLGVEASARPLVVLHMGDSHLSGGFMTTPIEQALESAYGAERVEVKRIGVPGATYETLSRPEYMARVKAIAPDVVVVSLGTNDSYSFRFDPEAMWQNMLAFESGLRANAPEARILLTTPPFAYLRQRGKPQRQRTKRGRWRTVYSTSYSFNAHTREASDLVLRFAKTKGWDAYDLYAELAGTNARQSAQRWLAEGRLGKDRVHYSASGYSAMGELVARALLARLAPRVGQSAEIDITDSNP